MKRCLRLYSKLMTFTVSLSKKLISLYTNEREANRNKPLRKDNTVS